MTEARTYMGGYSDGKEWAQADMLRTIKELQASLAWITEYIRAAPPELEEAKKWLLVMDNAAAGASPVEPSESAEHWHSLYIKKCQELHDEKARLGAEIETLELAAIDDAERYAVPPSQAQPPD